MLTHMLVQFPMLMLAGAGMAFPLRTHGSRRRLDSVNREGLSGLFYVAVMLVFWMLPLVLDTAVASTRWDAAKAVSLMSAGAVLYVSWPLASTVTRTFFVGNGAWMTAAAGLLYQELPQRLCNSYLQDDQERTGQVLVVLAAAAGLLWLGRLALHLHRLTLATPDQPAADGNGTTFPVTPL